MSIQNEYLQGVYADLCQRYPEQDKFLQAVEEVLTSLETIVEKRPDIVKHKIIERIVEPERIVSFRVTWVDDKGEVQVNRGYRVQANSAIGPYKGGIRLDPGVNLSVMKFLAFEQTFKNALTGLPMGGGKGGSDFNPKGKSDNEVMRFCQAFMNELYRHIGADVDVPAGDRGTGARELGYMFGQYRKLTNQFTGVFTGKKVGAGGSLGRTEATGYGLCYFVEEMLKTAGDTFAGKTVIISGSGNVGTYANQKATELSAKVIAMNDTRGYVYDPNGIDWELVHEIKIVNRGSLAEYAERVPTATYTADPKAMWNVPCDIALPCATENDIHLEHAQALIANGVKYVAEGANMPCTKEAVHAFLDAGIPFGPAKAANAGGVAVSGLEMSQNSQRLSWTFEEVDNMLKGIMKDIYAAAMDAAEKAGKPGNLVDGANIAGFLKVADAMIWQGYAF